MKSLAFLVFLFLAVPGSGQLAWDGIPFSTRIEFATLVLFLLAIFNRTIRDWVRTHLARLTWRGTVKPALALLVLLKFLTFTWYPYSDGFEACYRSLYYPLADSDACERSYEGPFLRGSDFGVSNTSRIDRNIDFGIQMHDWSLPFMNEFPRLGDGWLYRLPFSARYGARVENKTQSSQFVPILSIGKLEAWTNTSRTSLENYEFEQLSILRLEPGMHVLSLNFEYKDVDDDEPPDSAPIPRGPYASLKVGAVSTSDEIEGYARLRVRGWVFNTNTGEVPKTINVSTPGLGFSKQFELIDRPDVARHFDNELLLRSGFDFEIPLSKIPLGQVNLTAIFDSTESALGAVRYETKDLSKNIEATVESSSEVLTQFSGSFSADRGAMRVLEPGSGRDVSKPFTVIAWLIDFASLVLALSLFCGVFATLRKSIVVSLALGASAYGVIFINSVVGLSVLGSTLFLPIATISILVLLTVKRVPHLSLTAFLPVSVVLASKLSIDMLELFHGSKGGRWWGKLLFYWRDSDWYTIQGNARNLFLSGSLQAGEAVFWFNVAPRYLAYATRSLLGENDALVGIIMISGALFAFIALLASVLRHRQGLFANLVVLALLTIGLYFLVDNLIAGFGFVGSSEYPTWIVLFLIATFVIVTTSETRAWLLVGMSIALAYCIQSRHNQFFGLTLLFVALVFLVDGRSLSKRIATVSAMITAFVIVTSLSLLHNLYYGESFVPFSANASINEQFSWLDIFGITDGNASWSSVWQQVRVMMYWNPVGNWSWALMFWGSQILWVGVLVDRLRRDLILRARSLLLLIPFGYAIPMLKFQMGSYFPRHLVAINLAFLCTGLMAWPREGEGVTRDLGERALSSAETPG